MAAAMLGKNSATGDMNRVWRVVLMVDIMGGSHCCHRVLFKQSLRKETLLCRR